MRPPDTPCVSGLPTYRGPFTSEQAERLLWRAGFGPRKGEAEGMAKLWLSGSENNRWSPNENYARELMELFTLGHGHGYTEEDVRQQARALTGFRNDWSRSKGPVSFRYDPKYHDSGTKRVLGKRGHFT